MGVKDNWELIKEGGEVGLYFKIKERQLLVRVH